jgi:catechol 2,3-dioxygenase-like lactoylglutathione lyase family enzyme
MQRKTGRCVGGKFIIQKSGMNTAPLSFRCIKVIALFIRDLDRANSFYGKTLGLRAKYENQEQIGYLVGQTILMLKADLDVPPTEVPNPRVTIETENALRGRGVIISDPVQVYDKVHWVGSFLDSEGNKLWFCSYT